MNQSRQREWRVGQYDAKAIDQAVEIHFPLLGGRRLRVVNILCVWICVCMLHVSNRTGIKLKQQRKTLSSLFCTPGDRRSESGSIHHIYNMLEWVSTGWGQPVKGGGDGVRVCGGGEGQNKRENRD